MKTRIISAIVGLILLVSVVWCGQVILGTVIFLLALMGINEFYHSVEQAGYKPVKLIGYLSCLPILFIGIAGYSKSMQSDSILFNSINYTSFFMFLVIIALFFIIIFMHNKYNIIDIALTAFGMLYVGFMFSFIALTRNLENGLFYIWLIFIGAWATDTFAYFTGISLGKTKLIPSISPKKTVEGSIGGILGCVAITTYYGYFLLKFNYINNITLNHFLFLGILNGIISQIGDLAASAIKRYVNIKDYGNIMPGHGGVLDRFDSILFIAPVVYFYISFINA